MRARGGRCFQSWSNVRLVFASQHHLIWADIDMFLNRRRQEGRIELLQHRQSTQRRHTRQFRDYPLVLVMRFADEGNTEHRHSARAQGLDREQAMVDRAAFGSCAEHRWRAPSRSDEHTSEPQSLMRTYYPVFCLQKKQYT